MTDAQRSKHLDRQRRHARIRAQVSGTAQRPRIAVFKSNQYTYVQAIDDAARRTLASVDDRAAKGTKTERAHAAGKKLAAALKAKNVEAAVFDRGGFSYHGRVKAVAEALRESGIRV